MLDRSDTELSLEALRGSELILQGISQSPLVLLAGLLGGRQVRSKEAVQLHILPLESGVLLAWLSSIYQLQSR